MNITRHQPKPTPPPPYSYVISLSEVEMVNLREDLARFLRIGYNLRHDTRDLYIALLTPDSLPVREER